MPRWMAHAETLRENVNGFIDQAIDETMNGTMGLDSVIGGKLGQDSEKGQEG